MKNWNFSECCFCQFYVFVTAHFAVSYIYSICFSLFFIHRNEYMEKWSVFFECCQIREQVHHFLCSIQFKIIHSNWKPSNWIKTHNSLICFEGKTNNETITNFQLVHVVLHRFLQFILTRVTLLYSLYSIFGDFILDFCKYVFIGRRRVWECGVVAIITIIWFKTESFQAICQYSSA